MMDEVEKDLEVMGVTAIEDKLQEGVPETLKGLREAGVKVGHPLLLLPHDQLGGAQGVDALLRVLSWCTHPRCGC